MRNIKNLIFRLKNIFMQKHKKKEMLKIWEWILNFHQ